ncbi:hypothetical protein, partial [Klebsiella aerogenes]|uniref:hypothetical protein n=1 Tax=Klebsiella aerogenes TaxID=548 RepID=UPI001A91FE1C
NVNAGHERTSKARIIHQIQLIRGITNWSKQPPAVEAKPVKVGCPETDGDHSQLNRSLLP